MWTFYCVTFKENCNLRILCSVYCSVVCSCIIDYNDRRKAAGEKVVNY